LETTGTFILLHLLTLGNGPEPISPFLLYLLLTAASQKGAPPLPSDALISLETLYELDPRAADILQPWMMLKETDKLSGFGNGQIPHQLASIQTILNQSEYQLRTALNGSCYSTQGSGRS
jgi:hypothetical protein